MARAFLPCIPLILYVSSACAQDSTTSSASASPTNPTVTLDQATVNGVSASGVQQFLGIPYASPPVNELRFAPPQSVTSYNGTINATTFGYSCPQQNASLTSSFFKLPDQEGTVVTMKVDQRWADVDFDDDEAPPENEDCLTLNVMRPENTTQSSNLPVVIWIVGGGFETGTTQYSAEDDAKLVQRSTQLGQPMIFVSMNYRVSGWGFLSSQETKNVNGTNVGLKDQRTAIEWVNKYIGNFGGNSSRVTLWGQSAGAISSSLHMLHNNGNPDGLFSGAFMQSGAPIPVGNYTGGQPWYDQLVNQTNCTGSGDTLDCLRKVPYEEMKTVINRTPSYYSYLSLDLVWVPRADGDFIADNPQRLVEEGSVANIPFVSGNVADEGTVFALSSLNVTSDDEFREWLKFSYMSDVPDQNVSDVMELYPSDPSAGSPFNTSIFNAITSQYKRSAALQGDLVFQAPRRFFVQQRSGDQPVWAYQDSRGKYTPFVGAYHSSDLTKMVLNDYLIRFVNNLDPNNGTGPDWPKYDNSSKQIYWFTSDNDNTGVEISTDDYRVPQMEYLTNLSLAYPL
ncbi:CAZyme family CE10 [Agaricus bisporus var. burnettii]|uniref:Carboxylic ester hydrolase n=1 Tax=Agaricus bisporus var. burnettii TaxID=192524 RepID=A0A8H7FA46_AGABI|nr:CAZyme family CE10 [Agaricus bisporus var. burnettii]